MFATTRRIAGFMRRTCAARSYDSAEGGVARLAPHTSFGDPTAPSDKLPRESIEIRMLVFHAD
jgi:hypothetical protein